MRLCSTDLEMTQSSLQESDFDEPQSASAAQLWTGAQIRVVMRFCSPLDAHTLLGPYPHTDAHSPRRANPSHLAVVFP